MFGLKVVKSGNLPPVSPGLPYPPKQKRAPKTRWIIRTLWRLSRWVTRHGYHHRRPLAPAYVLIVAIGFGLGAHAGLVVAAFVMSVWLFGGAFLAWLLRRRNLDRVDRILAACAYASATSLVFGYAALGATRIAHIAAVIWLAGFGGYWWYQMYKPEAVEEVGPERIDDRLTVWLEHVAAQGGIAPRTELSDLSPVKGDRSWSAKIRTTGGKLTTRSLMAVQDNIGALYGATEGCCVIEPTEAGRLDEARLQVMSPNNPAHVISEYDWDWVGEKDGCVQLATHPDGTRGSLRIWLPMSGTVNEIMSGDTGSGKSVTLRVAITQSAMTGRVIPFVGDYPKNGASFPEWGGDQGLARWRAKALPEMRRQVRAIQRLTHDRYSRMSRLKWTDQFGDQQVGIGFYDPSIVPWDMYEVTWDEAQVACQDPEIAEILDDILTLVRACGIRFRFALPYPIAEELGGSVKVKQAMNAGNTVALRNNVKHAKGLTLPDWMPNPADIPLAVASGHSKGMCVLYSAAPNSQRPTFPRVVHMERPALWAKRAAQRIPEEKPEDLAALGDVYATWRERAERGDDARDEVKPTVIDLGVKPAAAVAIEPTTVNSALKIVKRYDGSLADQIKAYLRESGPATSGTIAVGIDRPLGSVSRKCSELLESGVLTGGKYSAYRLSSHELEGTAA